MRLFHTVASHTYNAPIVACPTCKDHLLRSQRSGSLSSLMQICCHSNDRFVQGFESIFDALNAVDGEWRQRTIIVYSCIQLRRHRGQNIGVPLHRLLTPWSGVSCGLRGSRRDSMRVQLALMILNFVRDPRSVIRDPVRNPEPHAGFNERLGPRTGSVFQRGIRD